MSYADFPYYQGIFKGTLIQSEEVFTTFSERATEFVNSVTFNRLADLELLNLYNDKLKRCVCALTEQYFRRNIATFKGVSDSENLPKTSESIGAYSVSFTNPYNYFQEISMSDSDFYKSLKSTIMRYLGNTGLLFRGVE